jgi:hypothetical protein
MSLYSFQTPVGFYVYAYIRADGTPYYIGKGVGRRAVQKHNIHIPQNPSHIVVCEQNLTELGALAIERRLISWYGRVDLGTGCLRNLTAGGDNSKISPTTRQKMSAARLGRTNPWMIEVNSRRKGVSTSLKGQCKADGHKLKIAAALKGRPKPKTVCRLVDRKELTLSNFNKWLKFHHPSELLYLIK